MARSSEDGVVLPHDPTHEETPIQAFANSNLTPEQSKRQAAPFLNSKELLRDFRGLSPVDQTKFVEKVDQVCRDSSLCSLEIFPSSFLQRRTRLSTRKTRSS